MYVLNQVDAVHAVAKRILQSNLKPAEVVDLITELKDAGYEEKDIKIKITHTVYEEGDEIEITKAEFDVLPEKVDMDKSNWIEKRKKVDAKNTIKYIFGDEPSFPIIGKLKSLRLNNEMGHLIVKWDNAVDDFQYREGWNETNVNFLEEMGYIFEQPKFEFIPIAEADDSLLNTHDIIIKNLIIQTGKTQAEAEEYLKPVYNAMQKAEAVFYRP